jgi:hypothetical protein
MDSGRRFILYLYPNKTKKREVTQMKKPLVKRIIVGTMALTLIGGSGYLLKGQNALAATDAATTTPAASAQASNQPEDNHALGMIKRVNDQLLAFLKLDKSAFQAKVAAGETLAQIATDQGIARDALKTELTAEANSSLDKEKADFALNIDKTVDSKLNLGGRGGHGGPEGHGGPGGPGGHGAPQADLAAAKALGYTTAAELHAALVKGTSIADLAAAKGVTLQTIIDLQVAALVKDLDEDLAAGKITQAQYDTQKADSSSRATNFVNDKHDGTGDFGGRGGINRKGHFAPNGASSASPSAAPSAAPSAS